MRRVFVVAVVLAVVLAVSNAEVQASSNGSKGCDCRTCHGNYADQCAPNSPPIANAGTDQTVRTGAVVTLNGSNSSDPNGSIASYEWIQIGTPTVQLANSRTAKATFTAPATGTSGTSLTFQLKVTDGAAATATDTCIVNVTPAAPANTPPTANAGPDQNVAAGAAVTLNGSNSTDGDGTVAGYAWTQTGGPTVALAGATSANPTFTAPSPATAMSLTFQLTAKDNGGLSATDTCIVNVSAAPAANKAPAANAGADQNVATGASVTLNASNSTDSDGTIVSYAWKQTAGTTMTLSNAAVASPTFTAPSGAASLTFQVTVRDNAGATATDTCIVNVTPAAPANAPPAANAGPDQIAASGATVMLTGANSTDGDGAIAAYTWTQTAGPTVTLSNASAVNPTFTAPAVTAATSLTFQLTVKDTGGLSATDTCIVNVSAAAAANKAPVASAGLDQAVDAGDTVTLDGAASTDPDDRIVSYLWKQTAGPTVTLQNPASAATLFAAPAGGTTGTSLTFQLTVTDSRGLRSSDTCIVNVGPSAGPVVNHPPVADAGSDQRVRRGGRVTLNGSGSGDPEHGALSYRWKQISGPPVTLSNSAAESPTFRVPGGRSAVSLAFRLTVTDDGGLRASDTCAVRVGGRSSSDDDDDDDHDRERDDD